MTQLIIVAFIVVALVVTIVFTARVIWPRRVDHEVELKRVLREGEDFFYPGIAKFLMLAVQPEWLMGDARTLWNELVTEGYYPVIHYGAESGSPYIASRKPLQLK